MIKDYQSHAYNVNAAIEMLQNADYETIEEIIKGGIDEVEILLHLSDNPTTKNLRHLSSKDLGLLSNKLISWYNTTISTMKSKQKMEKKYEEFTLNVGTIVTCTEPNLVGKSLEVVKKPRMRKRGRVLVWVRPTGSTRTYKVPIEMIVFPNGEHYPKEYFIYSLHPEYDWGGLKWSDYFTEK